MVLFQGPGNLTLLPEVPWPIGSSLQPAPQTIFWRISYRPALLSRQCRSLTHSHCSKVLFRKHTIANRDRQYAKPNSTLKAVFSIAVGLNIERKRKNNNATPNKAYTTASRLNKFSLLNRISALIRNGEGITPTPFVF